MLKEEHVCAVCGYPWDHTGFGGVLLCYPHFILVQEIQKQTNQSFVKCAAAAEYFASRSIPLIVDVSVKLLEKWAGTSLVGASSTPKKRFHLFSWDIDDQDCSGTTLSTYDGSFETIKEAKDELKKAIIEGYSKVEAEIIESESDGELCSAARFYVRDFADWYDKDGNIV